MKITCSLLNLPEEIKNALREGLIGVSQGYIFAANLDHPPPLREIFRKAIGGIHQRRFAEGTAERAEADGIAATATGRKNPSPSSGAAIQTAMTGSDEQVDVFRKSDLESKRRTSAEMCRHLHTHISSIVVADACQYRMRLKTAST